MVTSAGASESADISMVVCMWFNGVTLMVFFAFLRRDNLGVHVMGYLSVGGGVVRNEGCGMRKGLVGSSKMMLGCRCNRGGGTG